MERNLQCAPLVCSADMTGKEGYAITPAGALTGATGACVYGIVHRGQTTSDASEIAVGGEVDAVVNGTTAIAVGDGLTGGASGKMVKGTVGTHQIYAIALEAATTDGATIRVKLL